MSRKLKSGLGQLGMGAAGIATVAVLLGVMRGPSDVETTQQNIVGVLQSDQALARQRDNAIPKDASPSVITLAIDNYCTGLQNLDMSNCPADFRVAYREHIRAWRGMSAAIKQLPDSFVDGLFIGFINGLQGEMDGGARRMLGELKIAEKYVESTWSNVEQAGAKYGAAL